MFQPRTFTYQSAWLFVLLDHVIEDHLGVIAPRYSNSTRTGLHHYDGSRCPGLTFGNHHTSLSPGQYLKQGWSTHNRTKKNQLRWHQNQITKNMYLKISLPNVEYFLMASVCWNCVWKRSASWLLRLLTATMRYGRSREQSILAHWSNTYCSVECPRHWRATKNS